MVKALTSTSPLFNNKNYKVISCNHVLLFRLWLKHEHGVYES
jgi:hypothetical protein